MGFVKAAEKHYPVPQKDLGEIMNKPGVRPTFNFASMVNDSPDLQRLGFLLSCKERKKTRFDNNYKLIYLPFLKLPQSKFFQESLS